MLYLAIYALLAAIAFEMRKSPNGRHYTYPIVLGFFFIFAAFRFEIGCDWTGYLRHYHYGPLFEVDAISGYRDPLWWVFLSLVRATGLPYPWLNVAATALFFFGIHKLARRQPDPLAFLVLLFPVLIIHIGMSGIRQAVAIGIMCIAYNAFVDRKTVRFVVLVLIASAIHSSAMVFLLLTPLVTGPYSRSRIALAAVLAVPGTLLMLGSASAELAIDRYIDSGLEAFGAAYRVGLLALTGLAFFILLRRPWQSTGAPDYKLLSIGSLGMIALATLLPVSTVIADRLAYYFIPIQALMLARISFLPLGRLKGVYALLGFTVLGVTLAVWISVSNHYQACYTPYQTWIFGMPQSRYGL